MDAVDARLEFLEARAREVERYAQLDAQLLAAQLLAAQIRQEMAVLRPARVPSMRRPPNARDLRALELRGRLNVVIDDWRLSPPTATVGSQPTLAEE